MPDITAATAECASCHAVTGTDYHRAMQSKHTTAAMPSQGCIGGGCHVSNSLPEEHACFLSRYPGYSDTCALCHLNSDPARIDWTTASAACASCHDGHGDLTAAHTASTSTACFGCHTDKDVRTLHGGETKCWLCHDNPTRVPTLPANVECANCHGSLSPPDPNHYSETTHTASAETSCSQCHYLTSTSLRASGRSEAVTWTMRRDQCNPFPVVGRF